MGRGVGRVTSKGIEMSNEMAQNVRKEQQERRVVVPQAQSRNGKPLRKTMVETRSTASAQDFATLQSTTEISMASTFQLSNSPSNEDSELCEAVPRATRTVVKRKRIAELSTDHSDIASIVGNLSSIRVKSSKKSNETIHRVPKNGLYILCSETAEIINPELLKSPASLVMAALNQLETQDLLYGRIGRAYGVRLLAAPMKVQSFHQNQHLFSYTHINICSWVCFESGDDY